MMENIFGYIVTKTKFMIDFFSERPSDSQFGSPVDNLRIVKEKMTRIPSEPTNSSERYKNMRDPE
jgi:hypothetical protein